MIAHYPSKREQVMVDASRRSPVVAECLAVAHQALAAVRCNAFHLLHPTDCFMPNLSVFVGRISET